MSILTDVQADTSNILADWQETVSLARATVCVTTAGEEVPTWATSLVTKADVQSIRAGRRTRLLEAGLEFTPEYQVYFRQGVDVLEGDRFSFDGFTVYVDMVLRQEDKLVAISSRRSKDGGT